MFSIQAESKHLICAWTIAAEYKGNGSPDLRNLHFNRGAYLDLYMRGVSIHITYSFILQRDKIIPHQKMFCAKML